MSELKTTELRIGNYIKYGADTLSVKQFTERTILLNGLRDTLINIDSESAEPIPLTEEWFLKLGFVIRYFKEDKNKPLWWKVENNRHIEFYFEKQVNAYVFMINNIQYSIEIKYVHSIQNVYFALTGKELTHQKNN